MIGIQAEQRLQQEQHGQRSAGTCRQRRRCRSPRPCRWRRWSAATSAPCDRPKSTSDSSDATSDADGDEQPEQRRPAASARRSAPSPSCWRRHSGRSGRRCRPAALRAARAASGSDPGCRDRSAASLRTIDSRLPTAPASAADIVGDADPADDQRRQRDDDGEERIPEPVGRDVEQPQPIRLAQHQPPGAGQISLDFFSLTACALAEPVFEEAADRSASAFRGRRRATRSSTMCMVLPTRPNSTTGQ